MASPFQQQVRQRKFLYLGLIVVLFTAGWAWRHNVIDVQARNLAVKEGSRGEVELVGSVVRLSLTGSRGLATCILWNSAIEAQKKNQWNQLEVLVRSLTKLQPYFITPWLFQSWNLSYNVSVESDRVRDKYFYMTRGIELLGEGERQNSFHPDLRWSIGFYTQHKICQSDETNYLRSLFQLSLIPPNERDPARFWKQTDQGPEFNWAEFKKFCEAHPQLIRRLREGIYRETKSQKDQLYRRETPQEVVEFLEDNFSVPSMYRFRPPPAGVPAQARVWQANRPDDLLSPEERFPVLPPPHEDAFDPNALTTASALHDDTDGFAVAQSWYAYAQEPLPRPGPLPGSSEDIDIRKRQRRPKHMTTLIFRHYPAQGRRYMAERLQQEGWFDADPFDISDWFREASDPSLAGTRVEIGGGRDWSREAWAAAARAWEEHGLANHLLFKSQADEQNTKELAGRFARRFNLPTPPPYSQPPTLRTDNMTEQEKREYEAARFMYELQFYAQLTNFPHHHLRAVVEARRETVQCRKMFFLAERLKNDNKPELALAMYRTPISEEERVMPGGKRAKVAVWGDPQLKLSPLEAWRDLVLMKNKEYRRDNFNMEQTAEVQVRYLWLANRVEGTAEKAKLARAAVLVPLVPRLVPLKGARDDDFRAPITQGPFDVTDPEGLPLVEDRIWPAVLDRMGLPSARRPLPMREPPEMPAQPGKPQPAGKPAPPPVPPKGK
jgi:hypothetical protein